MGYGCPTSPIAGPAACQHRQREAEAGGESIPRYSDRSLQVRSLQVVSHAGTVQKMSDHRRTLASKIRDRNVGTRARLASLSDIAQWLLLGMPEWLRIHGT